MIFQQEFLAIIYSAHFFQAESRRHKFVILHNYKLLLTFIQQTSDSQNLKRWLDFHKTFDCTV